MIKKLTIIFLFLFNLNSCKSEEKKETPVDLVNVFIDTHQPRFDYFASATLPFGMVALSPDTKHGKLWDSGYRYGDEYILNFSHVHNMQTAGVPIMPVTGTCKGNYGLEANKSRFYHEKEEASPGYHKVYLEDYDIQVELTATCRVGMHRYTFPEAKEAHLIFDLCAALGPAKMSHAYVKQVSETEIEGYSVLAPDSRRRVKPYTVYFTATFKNPFNQIVGWVTSENDSIGQLVKPQNGIVEGVGSGIYLTYNNLQEGNELLFKVAISFVSMENARLNMKSELPHWDFEKVVEDAKQSWNEYLGRMEVEGGTREQRVKFYTDLIHTASKRIASDVDGCYPDYTGYKPVIRKVPLDESGNPKRHFIDGDGLWDTHWNLNILWSLVYPEYGNWVAETFLDYYRNAGMMSRCSWGGNYSYVMVGDHITPLLSALMSTGRNTFDPELAYRAARKNAFPGGIRDRAGYESGPNPQGGGIDWFIDLGYVPVEIKNRGGGFHRGGTAMTLEYAFQDWCLAQMAKKLGKEKDYKIFTDRSTNWQNVFDANKGWVRPRHISGEWMKPFALVSAVDKHDHTGFIEANAAIYSFFVPQDIQGLIDKMGGRNKFISKLDSSFIKASIDSFYAPFHNHAINWVEYNNQPSCGMAHLFSHAGAPWITQYWVREVKEKTFGGTDPYSGYFGDEDQGQLGALSALMAIGLFDSQGCVDGFPNLEITSPVFDRIVIKFPSVEVPIKTKTFEINVNKKNKEDIYIQSVMLNEKQWMNFEFPVSKFLAGGKLKIELGSKPNKDWGK